MVQIIEQGDPFAKFGAGLGKGFGDASAAAVERNMLSKGLERLSRGKEVVNPQTGAKEFQPYNPVELLAQGYKLPGFAENAGTFLPALQNAAYQKALQQQAQADTNIPSAAINPPPTQPVEAKGKAVAPAEKPIAPGRQGVGFSTPEERQERKKTLAREFSPSELAREKLKVAQSGITDRNEIEKLALENLKGPGLAIAANEAALMDKLNTRITDLLGADVQPGIRDFIREEAAHRIRQPGKTPDEVAGEMAPILDDIARAKTQIQNTAGNFFTRIMNQGAKYGAYKEQEKIFDKYGLREQFLDLVKSKQGLTYIQAAQDFDPLQNATVKKTIKSLPQRGEGIALLNEKNLKSILDNIKPEDNMLSIAGELRDKNYSVTHFLEEARKLDNLTPEQRRQLQKPENNSIVGDIFWRAFK
jgi:hypothetical protein